MRGTEEIELMRYSLVQFHVDSQTLLRGAAANDNVKRRVWIHTFLTG